jgi:hypothetical protein
MTPAVENHLNVWQRARTYPLQTLGVDLHLILRSLFGLFWLPAAHNKISKDWLSTDVLKDIYLERLTELPPEAFAVLYLQHQAPSKVEIRKRHQGATQRQLGTPAHARGTIRLRKKLRLRNILFG